MGDEPDRSFAVRHTREGRQRIGPAVRVVWRLHHVGCLDLFFVVLANPGWAEKRWPLSTVDVGGADFQVAAAAIIDLVLIALFGLQPELLPFVEAGKIDPSIVTGASRS